MSGRGARTASASAHLGPQLRLLRWPQLDRDRRRLGATAVQEEHPAQDRHSGHQQADLVGAEVPRADAPEQQRRDRRHDAERQGVEANQQSQGDQRPEAKRAARGPHRGHVTRPPSTSVASAVPPVARAARPGSAQGGEAIPYPAGGPSLPTRRGTDSRRPQRDSWRSLAQTRYQTGRTPAGCRPEPRRDHLSGHCAPFGTYQAGRPRRRDPSAGPLPTPGLALGFMEL